MLRPALLKLSGETLGSERGPIDLAAAERVGSEIVTGMQHRPAAIVVGGGNIIRGGAIADKLQDPTRGDYMGMLATCMNALALRNGIEETGGKAIVMAPRGIPNVAEDYIRERAVQLLADGVAVIFGGGTGHPFFTTDTASALRAAEINADVILKASQVDGVYSADPKKDPNAKRYDSLTMDEAIAKRLQIMDQTAFAICRERTINIRVFDAHPAGAIASAFSTNGPGTIVRSPGAEA